MNIKKRITKKEMKVIERLRERGLIVALTIDEAKKTLGLKEEAEQFFKLLNKLQSDKNLPFEEKVECDDIMQALRDKLIEYWGD